MMRAFAHRLALLAATCLSLAVWRDFGYIGFPLENTRGVLIVGAVVASSTHAAFAGLRLFDDDPHMFPFIVPRARLLILGTVSVGLALWEDYGWAGLQGMPNTVRSVEGVLYVGAALFAAVGFRWDWSYPHLGAPKGDKQ